MQMFKALPHCVALFPGRHEQMSIHPRQRTNTDQCKGTTEIHLGEPVRFIGVTHRSISDGYLQKWLKDSCIPKAYLSMGDSSWKLGTWRTVDNLLSAQQVGECLSRQLSWSEPLPVSLADLYYFEVVLPDSLAGLKSVSLFSLLICSWGRRDLVNLAVSLTSWHSVLPASRKWVHWTLHSSAGRWDFTHSIMLMPRKKKASIII